MMRKWFNAREASVLGGALADQFVAATPRSPPGCGAEGKRKERPTALEELHKRADAEVKPLQLNFYQKARFANSFKWKLIENGVEARRRRRRDSVPLSQAFSGTYGGPNRPPRTGYRDAHCA